MAILGLAHTKPTLKLNKSAWYFSPVKQHLLFHS